MKGKFIKNNRREKLLTNVFSAINEMEELYETMSKKEIKSQKYLAIQLKIAAVVTELVSLKNSIELYD